MKWMSSPSISVMNCGKRVESGLDLAPIVLRLPMSGELLHRRQLDALGIIGNSFAIRPACCRDATSQVVDSVVRELGAEGANPLAGDRCSDRRWDEGSDACRRHAERRRAKQHAAISIDFVQVVDRSHGALLVSLVSECAFAPLQNYEEAD